MKFDGIRVTSFSTGRVRLKVPELKKAPDFASSVRERLGSVPGIKDVETNETTGSVLVTFDEQRLATEEALKELKQVLSELFPDKNLGRLYSLLQSQVS